MRAAAAPAARPNSAAVAAEARSARPRPGTATSAARRGAAAEGAGARGASDCQERRGDLSPSSLRNRRRLRTQPPRPRAPPRCRLSPSRSPRDPRDGRAPPRRVGCLWKDATRGGRKFIRLATPPRRWERKLQERSPPSAASPSRRQRRGAVTRPPPGGGRRPDAAPRLGAPAAPRPGRRLSPARGRSAPGRHSLARQQFRRTPSRHNPNPLQLASGEGDSTLFTFSPCQSERPFGGEVRLELGRAANPTVPFRCLVLSPQAPNADI